MTMNSEIARAIEDARKVLAQPVTPEDLATGWDEEHRVGWLESIASIERYLSGDESGPGFSIVRSLDMGQGSDSVDNSRGQALLAVSAVLSRHGIDRYA